MSRHHRDTDPGGGIPSIDPAFDTRFRHLTACGNRACGQDDVIAAGKRYGEAAQEADRLFEQAMGGGAAAILIGPMAVTVAALNRAGLTLRAGEPGRALALCRDAAERLLTVASSASTPLALRLNCLRHLRHVLHFLADLDEADPESRAVAVLLTTQTATVAQEVIRIAEILRADGADPERTGSPKPGRPGPHPTHLRGPARRDL